mgnify:CR=1 FL=1
MECSYTLGVKFKDVQAMGSNLHGPKGQAWKINKQEPQRQPKVVSRSADRISKSQCMFEATSYLWIFLCLKRTD